MKKKLIIDQTIEEANADLEKDQVKYSRAENTLKSYKKDFGTYEYFCEQKSRDPFKLDYEVITAYLKILQNQQHINKFSTIKRHLFAINYFYNEKNLEFDTKNKSLVKALDTISKKMIQSVDKTPPLLMVDLDKIIDEINYEIEKNKFRLINYRDKALILIAWYGAFRRSEVANLEINNVKKVNNGLLIKLNKSKNDQKGKKGGKPIPRKKTKKRLNHCPENAYQDWIKISEITSGRIFRHIDSSNKLIHETLSDKSVANIIKKWAKKSNILEDKLSGHSFRSGYATELAMRGASIEEIMEITHHSSESTAKGYIQMAKEYRKTPTEKYIPE